MSDKKERLKKRISGLRESWNQLDDKIKEMSRAYVKETRVEERLRLQQQIEESEKDLDQLEKQITKLESELKSSIRLDRQHELTVKLIKKHDKLQRFYYDRFSRILDYQTPWHHPTDFLRRTREPGRAICKPANGPYLREHARGVAHVRLVPVRLPSGSEFDAKQIETQLLQDLIDRDRQTLREALPRPAGCRSSFRRAFRALSL